MDEVTTRSDRKLFVHYTAGTGNDIFLALHSHVFDSLKFFELTVEVYTQGLYVREHVS